MEDRSACAKDMPCWTDLPVEIWLEILKFLPHATLLFVVRPLCRLFSSLTFDPTLWRNINLNEWKIFMTTSFLSLDSYQSCGDDLDEFSLKLLKNGHLNSTDLFSTIIKMVNRSVLSISFSRYSGDFVFGLNELVAVQECGNLTYLDVGFCDEINSSSLQSICGSCTRIKTLILEGCHDVTNDGMESVSKLPHLEKLDISHCASVTNEGIQYIACMPSQILHFISDGVLHLTDSGLVNLIARQTKIETLIVDGEELTDMTVVLASRTLQNLSNLQISFCNNITDLSFESELCNRKLKHLRMKKMSQQISTPCVTNFFVQEAMCGLRNLTFTDCDAVANLTAAAISSCCPLIESICLDWCVELTDDGIEELIHGCNKLKRMSLVGLARLKGTWLCDVDQHLPNLELLDLSLCNMIPDEHLFALIQRKPTMLAYTYYHEQVDSSSVSDLIASRNFVNETTKKAEVAMEPTCAGSKGASVDF